jgi:hypothetical protein
MAVDYCDTEDEQAKNPCTKRDFALIANNDAQAYDFLWQFWCFEHCFDDLVDRDKETSPEMVMRTIIKFLEMMTYNQFWLRNRETIFPFIVSTATRWLDGDEWACSPDERQRSASQVIRSGDVDLFLHIAYLTGGWDHLRAVKNTRAYDWNDDQGAV